MAEPRSAEPRIVADLGRPETPEEIAARKAESSRRYRDSKTTRNLVIALVASLALVLFTVLVVVRPEQAPRPPVDYELVASQTTASAPLTVPELGDDWSANRAQLSTGNDGIESWNIGFLTPDNQYIAFAQGIDANPSWVIAILGTVQATGTTTIDGVEWTVYDNSDSEDPGNFIYSMTAEIDGSTYVLNGTADTKQFDTLAEAITR
jgi:hypothetical protein